MKAMRLGVDMHTATGIHQGVRTHLLNIYAQAVAQNPNVEFIFLGSAKDHLINHDVAYDAPNVYCVDRISSHSASRLLYEHSLLQKRYGLDIAHYQYICPIINYCPVAVTIHDLLFETHPQYFSRLFRYRSRMLVRQTAKKSSALFTVSGYSKQQIARHYRIDPTAIHITTNAVDQNLFCPGPEGSEMLRRRGLTSGNYLLSVGRLEPRKNYANLLRAYAMLESPPPLVIVGQQDFGYAELYRIMQRADLRNRVYILSDVSSTELAALYRHASLFVYPSFAEGFGMPLLEAFASGTAVICATGTALDEVAVGTALQIDPESPDALAVAISRVLQQDELRLNMIAAGLSRSRQYTWRQSADALMSGLLSAC